MALYRFLGMFPVSTFIPPELLSTLLCQEGMAIPCQPNERMRGSVAALQANIAASRGEHRGAKDREMASSAAPTGWSTASVAAAWPATRF